MCIRDRVWLYFSQLKDSFKCQQELSRQRLIFQENKIQKQKEEKKTGKNVPSKSFLKKASTIISHSSIKKGHLKSFSKNRIYSEKSVDIQTVTDFEEEFNIFEDQSTMSLPEEISDFQIRLRSDYFEESRNQEEKVRFIGDEGFIARVEQKYLEGVDRAGDIGKQKNKSPKDVFQIQRDKILNLREILKDFIEKIVEYIRRKYPEG